MSVVEDDPILLILELCLPLTSPEQHGLQSKSTHFSLPSGHHFCYLVVNAFSECLQIHAWCQNSARKHGYHFKEEKLTRCTPRLAAISASYRNPTPFWENVVYLWLLLVLCISPAGRHGAGGLYLPVNCDTLSLPCREPRANQETTILLHAVLLPAKGFHSSGSG